MKLSSRVLPALAALLVASSANAATLSISATAPTVDGQDIANLVVSTGAQSVWSDRPVQGNTFDSGSLAGTLNALTIQLSEEDKAPITGWKDYVIRVGTVTVGAPNVFTEISMETVRQTGDANNDDYFTFVLDTPVTLAANTLYGFQVGITGSEENWPDGIPAMQTGGNSFAGGQRLSGERPNQGFGTTAGLGNDDVIFHLDIDPVPEPSSVALLGLGIAGMILRRRRQ